MSAATVAVAVNGTLMRGLRLNTNLTGAGATFERETATASVYRLWSIDDDHPGMIRVTDGTGAAIAVEIWRVPAAAVATILEQEPPGLCVGKVQLEDGSVVLGVLAEPALVHGQREITELGGWRAYVESAGIES